jgi:hypothetical protein
MSMNGLGGFAAGMAQGFAATWKPELIEKVRANKEAERQRDEKLTQDMAVERQQAIQKAQELTQKQKIATDKAYTTLTKDYATMAKESPRLAAQMWNAQSDINGFGKYKSFFEANDSEYLMDYGEADKEMIKEIQADISTYNGDGLYKLDKTGVLYSRGSDAEEFKPTGIRAMDVKMLKEQESGLKKSDLLDIVGADGEQDVMSITQYYNMPENERPKLYQKPTSSSSRRDSLQQKEAAAKTLNEAKLNYQQNPTEANAAAVREAEEIYTSTVKGKSEAKEYDEKNEVKTAVMYGRKMSPEAYDPDEALNIELDFKYTDVYQRSSTLKKEEDEFSNAIVTYNQTDRLYNVFSDAVANGEYKSGIIDTSIKTVSSYTPAQFTNLIGLDREDIKKQIGLEGEIGDAVAQYLKGLSGTAASQNEFSRTLSNFIGDSFKQEDTREATIKAFTQKKKVDLDKRAKQLAKRGLVSTAGNWLYKGKTPKKTTGTGTGNSTLTKEAVSSMTKEERIQYLLKESERM